MRSKSLLLVLALCMPATAMAYVDPGSGMLLWQGLMAALGAAIVFVREPWHTIKCFWKRIWRK